MDGQCVAYLPDGAKARLDRFKFAWHLLLDTPSVPRGKAGDVETAAIKLAAGQTTFCAPLKPTQLVGVALFIEDVLDVTVEAAETVMEAAKVVERAVAATPVATVAVTAAEAMEVVSEVGATHPKQRA